MKGWNMAHNIIMLGTVDAFSCQGDIGRVVGFVLGLHDI